ncbi:MAG TPA: hypothetical protein VF692_01610, partial [Pyrinomonadaceae bacterium]
TSAAVRALERARRNRGKFLLEDSREQVKEQKRRKRELAAEEKKKKAELAEKPQEVFMIQSVTDADLETRAENNRETIPGFAANERQNGDKPLKKEERENKNRDNPFADRKPISEVLHDIYDKNIQ